MAKGELTAKAMLEQQFPTANMIHKTDVVKLMRKFSEQEVLWWQKHCDKWEKAYHELQKITDG